MDEARREELFQNWDKESPDPEEQAWRDDLTPEELEYVAQLDDHYTSGVAAICTAILVRERIRQRFGPREIQELETIRDHCRLRLRDGRLYLARLTAGGELRLDEIEAVC